MSQQQPERSVVPSVAMPSAQLAPSAGTAIGFRLRIGHTTLPPTTTGGGLRAAIEQANLGFRRPGLDDTLNPDIIDADKATALVAALPGIARRSPQLLAGRELSLSHAGLRIGAADATTAASFAKPFELEVVDIKGDTLLARATVPVVLQLARERAAQAKAELAIENQKIVPLQAKLRAAADVIEDKRAILDELTPALWRRSALARAWSANARELSEQPGADAEAKAQTEAASKAVKEYLLPTGAGMPR
jgi:hypothetical protein